MEGEDCLLRPLRFRRRLLRLRMLEHQVRSGAGLVEGAVEGAHREPAPHGEPARDLAGFGSSGMAVMEPGSTPRRTRTYDA
jgi:hypothetical protein